MKTTAEMRTRLRELCHPVAGRDDYDRAVLALLDDFETELTRLEKLVYVPGALKCAKCGFGLLKTNLHVVDGNFSANNEPDYCPNDGAPLWRVTERDAGNEMIDRASEMSDELRLMRSALEEIAQLDKHGGYNSACHRARAALSPKRPQDAPPPPKLGGE